MIFKMYDCDFGIKLGGIYYEFPHVNEFQIEDPETTKLTRGANASNKIGLVYTDGVKEPKKVTVTIIGMTPDIKDVLDQCFANKTRVDVYAVNRGDGSSKIAKNAVLSTAPQQLTMSEAVDSLNVALIFESFDLSETHKS